MGEREREQDETPTRVQVVPSCALLDIQYECGHSEERAERLVLDANRRRHLLHASSMEPSCGMRAGKLHCTAVNAGLDSPVIDDDSVVSLCRPDRELSADPGSIEGAHRVVDGRGPRSPGRYYLSRPG